MGYGEGIPAWKVETGEGLGYLVEEVGPEPELASALSQSSHLDPRGKGEWPGGAAGLLAAGIVVIVVVLTAVKRARWTARFAVPAWHRTLT